MIPGVMIYRNNRNLCIPLPGILDTRKRFPRFSFLERILKPSRTATCRIGTLVVCDLTELNNSFLNLEVMSRECEAVVVYIDQYKSLYNAPFSAKFPYPVSRCLAQTLEPTVVPPRS